MALTKRPNSPFWYAEWMMNGKRYVKSTKTTNRQVAAQIEHKYRDQILKQEILGENKPITLLQILTLTAKSKNTLSKSSQALADIFTRKLTKQRLKKARKVKNSFGFDPSLPFDKLTEYDIHELIRHRREEGVAEQTIIHELTFIGQAVKLAKRLQYKHAHIEVSVIAKINNVRPAPHRVVFLTDDQQEHLLNNIDSANTKDLCEILLHTGARWGEIAKLKWSAVDFEHNTITIYREKTKNTSKIVMSKRVRAILERRDKSSVYVFSNTKGDEHIGYDLSALHTACHKAGLPQYSYHALRHSFASKMVQRGVPLYAISKVLGHKLITTTAKYSHLVEEEQSKIVAKILDE